ncbi:hypothetical protein NDU88_002650 [Pleurodeles waltl]|uniref:Uncharacterized protein n=1 Tax=Pleurodeles waltl TaxID=8319 RepID=A0AAV7QCD2_PLEWA|nr:hypothetical protein NDU88_002650 [Pleurodeles waltl]
MVDTWWPAVRLGTVLDYNGKSKQHGTPQGNTKDLYVLLAPASQCAACHTSGRVGQCEETGEPSRAELMQAIQGSRQALESKIEMVAIEVNLLRTDLCKVSDKVCVAEGSIEQLQAEVVTLNRQVAAKEAHSGALEARVEDSEGRARSNNVRLLGFPEWAEGTRPEQFMEAWIRDTLKPVGLTPMFAIERAHRVSVALLWPGALTQAIIYYILNYKDRNSMLRAARDTDDTKFENHRISIYPDNTTKVQTARKTFLEVKAKLRLQDLLMDSVGTPIIWARDFNCVLDGERYRHPPRGGKKIPDEKSPTESNGHIGAARQVALVEPG